MDKLFFCHTHYIPKAFLDKNEIQLGAVIIPEVYPDLIYKYYGDVEYFCSPFEFISFFERKNLPMNPKLYSIENINMISNIEEFILLKKSKVCSVQLFHHGNNPYFDIHHGITRLGKELLEILLKQDIALDLSHLNDFWINRILRYYPGRVLVSHCAISEFLDDPVTRSNNISIKTIELLIKRNALIGISFVNDIIAHKCGEQDDKEVYKDIVEQVLFIIKQYGSKSVCIGPDYFDTTHFSKVYKKKIFIPDLFYSMEGYRRLREHLNAFIPQDFLNDFFWNNAKNFYNNQTS